MTELIASIHNRRAGITAQSNGTVIGGTFEIEPLGPSDGLTPGVYQADVTMPYARYQPGSGMSRRLLQRRLG